MGIRDTRVHTGLLLSAFLLLLALLLGILPRPAHGGAGPGGGVVAPR